MYTFRNVGYSQWSITQTMRGVEKQSRINVWQKLLKLLHKTVNSWLGNCRV